MGYQKRSTPKPDARRTPPTLRARRRKLRNEIPYSVFGEREERDFEKSPYPIRIFDRESLRYLAVNEAALKLYGYTREKFLALTLFDTRHPDERTQIVPSLAEPTGYLRHLPQRQHVTKSGETVAVELIVQDIVYRGRQARLSLTFDVTQRARAEEELKRQKQLLETVVENLPVGVFMKDAKTLRLVMRNRANREMMRSSAAEEIGKTPHELHPKEQADYITAIDRKVLETGEMIEITEQEIVSQTGRVMTQHVRKVPVLDESGKPWLLLGISDDVTERKRIERALRESEEFLRRVIESSRDCIKVLDMDGRITWVNTGGQALMEAGDTALLGKSYLEFWNEAEHAAAFNALAAAREGKTGRFEGYCATAAGTPKWWDEIVTPILGPDGRPEKILVASRDITESRQSQRELQRQRRLLDAIIDNLPLAVFVTEPFTGRHIMRNRIARERFGELPGAADGATLHERDPGILADKVPATDRIAFDTRQMVEDFEEEAIGPSGRRRIQHVRKVPLFDDRGRPWILVGIADDITQQKRREEELKRQKKLLDAVIEYLPVGVTVKDARTLRYLLRNRMAEDLTGLSHSATRGKRADEVWPPHLARSINETDSRTLAGGTPVSSDFAVLRQLRGRIVRNLKVPVPDDRGKYTHLVSILEDLTDIETAHAALRRSEERLRQLISMSPATIFSFSIEPPHGATFISENVTAQLGWQPSDFTSDPCFWLDRIHPDDRAATAEAVAKIATEGRYVCEYRFRHRDGTWRWMRDEGRGVRNEDGAACEAIGIWMDITAQKEESEQRLQHALRQRDALVKEVHHRIKNHLQGLAGLLRQKAPAHPAVTPLLESVVAQMNSVAVVYGLQSGADARVTVEQVLKAVCTSLEGLVPCRIIRKWDPQRAPSLALVESAAVPIAVALNELMHNAAKHGERRAGVVTIEVEYAEQETHAAICITNAGNLPAGFDYASGAGCGTGLDLMKTLLDPRGSMLAIGTRGERVQCVLMLDPPLVVWQPLETAA